MVTSQPNPPPHDCYFTKCLNGGSHFAAIVMAAWSCLSQTTVDRTFVPTVDCCELESRYCRSQKFMASEERVIFFNSLCKLIHLDSPPSPSSRSLNLTQPRTPSRSLSPALAVITEAIKKVLPACVKECLTEQWPRGQAVFDKLTGKSHWRRQRRLGGKCVDLSFMFDRNEPCHAQRLGKIFALEGGKREMKGGKRGGKSPAPVWPRRFCVSPA